MNTLHDLTDAFDELDRRADEHAAATHPAADRPTRLTRRRARLVRLAPIASALAVLAVAVAAVTWVQHGRTQAGSGSPTPTSASTSAPAPSVSPSPTGPTPVPTPAGWSPPATSDALAAKARTILGTTATITVIDDGPTSGPQSSVPQSSGSLPTVPTGAPTASPTSGSTSLPTIPGGTVTPLPSSSGAAIRGLLTADGHTGGYDLNVFAIDPSTPPQCEDQDIAVCTVRPDGHGGYLLISRESDSAVPGGMTVAVERLRADGADVLIHLSTEKDPKGSSTVTSPTLPLTVQQLIAFVSSDRW